MLAIGVGALMMFIKGHKSEETSEKTIFAMDTACSVKVSGADADDICDEIERIDEIFDCHSESSEISKINSDGGGSMSSEFRELVEQSLELTGKYPETDISVGAVTKLWNVTGKAPKVPEDDEIKKALDTCGYEKIKTDADKCTLESGTLLDVGAVAKGYALDKVRQLLEKQGAGYAVVSMGSSSLMYGEKPDGKDFTVAVKDPEDKNRLLVKFTTKETFVSTSGGYERYFEADGKRYIHIFDKTTGRPVETDIVSATVICDNGLKSDQLSTAVFIGGTKKLSEFFADDSIQIIAVDTSGTIHISKELDGRVTLESNGHKIVVEQ